jgi:protein-L-isoaspartate(D-aspartate) O-methyltransferase
MKRIDEAFRKIKRYDFVPADQIDRARLDIPLPIGHNQTISQPTTVRDMLEWLDPLPGQKILDVGSGSGWTASLLAHIVGEDGVVHAVERIPELIKFGQVNCHKYGLKNISFHKAGSVYGLPKEAPYDRILVSATTHKVPEELIEQLSEGGRLVIPIKTDVLVISKKPGGKLTSVAHPGFIFVPLI